MGSLSVTMRTSEDGNTSAGLQLAEGYRSSVPHPADDEMLSDIAKKRACGDLEVLFWKGSDDLIAQVNASLSKYLDFSAGDYKAFNASLGINDKTWENCEAWQILSPTRSQHYGTDDLNRRIQHEYKGGLITCKSYYLI